GCRAPRRRLPPQPRAPACPAGAFAAREAPAAFRAPSASGCPARSRRGCRPAGTWRHGKSRERSRARRGRPRVPRSALREARWARTWARSPLEAIPVPAHGEKVARVLRVRLHLYTQRADEVVHRARSALVLGAPAARQDVLPRERAPARLQEEPQHLELL